jgi:hypothetical protein
MPQKKVKLTDGEIFAGFGMDVRDLSVEIIPAAIEVLV